MSGTNQEYEGLSDEMLGDFLEPLDAGFSKPGSDEVDDMLDVIAREVDGNAQDMGPPPPRARRGSNVSLDLDPAEFEAFTGSLEESLAKFDEFLERANASNHGSEEFDDELTELRPIETLREKRGRDHGVVQSGSLVQPGMPSRIRNISGEKLSSMPAMHQGYSTMSSLNNNNNGLGTTNSPQKNQTWNKPEPVLGEVTGNKMRRLLSEQSYFQSRPLVPNDASRNAPWNQPKAPTVSARTAMQSLLNGGTSPTHSQTAPTVSKTTASNAAGWPGPQQPFRGVTSSQIQHSHSPTSGFQSNMESSGITQSVQASQNASKPMFASVTLEDMQRLAGTGATFQTQAATAGTTMPQNPAQARQATTYVSQQQQQTPMFATVSLQDMQRLANSGVAFPSAATPGSVGQTTMQTGGHTSAAPKPTFATVSLQDMHRLAATGVSAPTQPTPVQASSMQASTMQQPKQPVFTSVSLQDMQRLANSGPVFPGQSAAPASTTQAPTPPWSTAQPVTLQNMQSMANNTPSHSTQSVPTQSQGNSVQSPPWAVSNQKPAAPQVRPHITTVPLSTTSNPMSGSYSYGNITAATSTPKPVFGTVSVSLEDMQRLASTGVTHPTVPVAPSRAPVAATASQNAPWNAPKPVTETSNTVSTQHAAAPKPSFASVTLEDMQRLVNAYSEHQKPPQPKEATIAPKPTPTVEQVSQTATVVRTESVPRPASAEPVAGDNVRMNASVSTASTASSKGDNVIRIGDTTPPTKVSEGAMQQMLSDEFQSTATSGSKAASNDAWPDAVASNKAVTGDDDSVGTDSTKSEDLEALPSDPDEMLTKLRSLMDRSSSTQQALQDYDKKRGLPRSHSQTMVNSSRSRKQLLEGKIISKWDGSPLISDETELGKPRPRTQKKADETPQSNAGGSTDIGGTSSTTFAAV